MFGHRLFEMSKVRRRLSLADRHEQTIGADEIVFLADLEARPSRVSRTSPLATELAGPSLFIASARTHVLVAGRCQVSFGSI